MNKIIKILAVLLLIMGFSFVISYYKNNVNIYSDSNRADNSRPLQQENKPAPTITKKVGEEFTLWDIKYKVISAIDRGSTYNYHTSKGKFIEIKIEAENIGKKEVGTNKISLIDNQGRQFSFDLITSLNTPQGYSVYGITSNGGLIKPGFSEKFAAIFEVPKDAKELQLEYPSAQGHIVLRVQLGI